MATQFNIENILVHGALNNELEYERALVADRKLRLLSKDNSELKSLRSKLRDIIQKYENENWSTDSEISEASIHKSDIAVLIAEKERQFLMVRKNLIKKRLKKFNLNQQELGQILGHNSKSYMSELMNGLVPFTLKDLVVINRLLKIDLVDLIPTTLSHEQTESIKSALEKIGAPKKLQLAKDDFDLILT